MDASRSPLAARHSSLPTNVRGALKEAMLRLRASNVPSHTLAAELLLTHVLGRNRTWLYTHPEELIENSAAERFFELVARRIAGTPTQYLTGKQEFWGLEFEVTPAVLIPRPETEHVVEVALERIGPPKWEVRSPAGAGMRIADVGTGSGCLAVALARELPGAKMIATDISTAALEVARRNAARHGVAARIEFVECNLLDAFFGHDAPSVSVVGAQPAAPVLHLDLIVSNPPYVARADAPTLPREVAEHEPARALFGGEDGSEIYPALVRQAADLLVPGGLLVLELGYDTLDRVRPLVDDDATWTLVTVTNDLAGIPRVLAAERK
jgi:release factor glutamine methyltransferase